MLPIVLTDAAKARIGDLVGQRPGALGVCLRIAQGKGCGGNEYKMEHVTEDQPGFDKIAVSETATLYIPMADSFLMFGMTIDYGEDGLGNTKFIFTNPNESGRCGCGESFSIDPTKSKPG